MDYLMKTNNKARRRLRRLMRKNAIKIQCAWRSNRARKIAQQLRRGRAERLAFLFKMATRLVSGFRGHMGRRRYRTIWNLERIKNAHPLVLAQALRRNKFGNKVWWYTKPAELRLLYFDYYELVDRLGKLPPLHLVEKNIEEIKCRVHAIESEYATLIQKTFRGLVGRRFIVQYRYLVCGLLQHRMHAAFIIQRCYRAWRDTKRLRNTRRELARKRRLVEYKVEKRIKDQDEKLAGVDERVMKYYKKSYSETQGALYTGKVAFGENQGKKYLALRESSYYTKGKLSNETVFKSNMVFKETLKHALVAERSEMEQRANFVTERRKCSKALCMYFEEEFSTRRQLFNNGSKSEILSRFKNAQNIRKHRAPGKKLLEAFERGEVIGEVHLPSLTLKRG
jgi:hypothetical protein